MSSVRELFEHGAVAYAGTVRWGEDVPLAGPGIYIVATTHDPGDASGLLRAPLALDSLSLLLETRPEATVDGAAADIHRLAEGLNLMWPVGEPVLYIGLAGYSVQARVRQFYATRIGARGPHAGGWPIKMLEGQSLWIHFGASKVPGAAEAAMVDHFVDRVPVSTKQTLADATAPLPFANLRFPTGRSKRHGLAGVKASRSSSHIDVPTSPRLTRQPEVERLIPVERTIPMSRTEPRRRTQNVTDADLQRGQIRIPRTAKSILPVEKTRIRIMLGTEVESVLWDPQTSGTRERSGVIRVGRALLARHVAAGGPREIELGPDDTFLIS